MKHLRMLIVFTLLTSAIHAQFGSAGTSDPVSTGLGKTYTATSRGIYAVGINPANLALSNDKRWELSLLPFPNLSMRAGTDFLTITEFNYFFGGENDSAGKKVGRYLTPDDKDRMLNLFHEGGTFLLDFSILDFGFTWKPSAAFGAIGFVVTDVFSTTFKFPAGIFDLVLNGNPVSKECTLNDLEFESLFLREYNITYARELPFLLPGVFKQFSIGLGNKFVSGYGYAGLRSIDTRLITNPDRSITGETSISTVSSYSPSFGFTYDFDTAAVKGDGSFSIFPEAAGSGTAFDIGIAGAFSDKFRFGVSVTDIGKITWEKNVAEYDSKSNFTLKDASDIELRDSLIEAMKPKGKYGESFDTELPTTLRVGLAFAFSPKLMLAFDYNKPMTTALRNSDGARYSFGLEWDAVSWLPYIRLGYSYDQTDLSSVMLGGGFCFGPLECNFATPDVQYIFTPNEGKRVSFASGVRLKFN
jgi:hypothetical protein